MTHLADLIDQVKKRHAALEKIQKPYKKIASAISWMLFAYQFFKTSGEFTFTLLGLAVLALFLLYYATSIAGIRCLARRFLAVLIDCALVSIALFALVSYYRIDMERPEDILQLRLSNLSMLALWLTFLYFVVFDSRLGGTLGKRCLGLRVVEVEKNTKISINRSFIRTWLSLPLPIIGATWLAHWVAQDGQSATRLLLGDALKNAVTAFVPMSIMFLEGNQSIVDRVCRTAVRAEREPMNVLTRVTASTWTKLGISTVAWAFLASVFLYIAVFRPYVYGPSKRAAQGESIGSFRDPQRTAGLWVFLPMGLKEPTYGIRSIEYEEVFPNPFSYDSANSRFRPPFNPEPYLKSTPSIQIVRVALARKHPLQVKLLVLENFISIIAAKTPREKRPALSVLQLETREEYGLFSVLEHENILVGWANSARDEPLNFYCDVQPSGGTAYELSIDRIGFLLMGAGIPYTNS